MRLLPSSTISAEDFHCKANHFVRFYDTNASWSNRYAKRFVWRIQLYHACKRSLHEIQLVECVDIERSETCCWTIAQHFFHLWSSKNTPIRQWKGVCVSLIINSSEKRRQVNPEKTEIANCHTCSYVSMKAAWLWRDRLEVFLIQYEWLSIENRGTFLWKENNSGLFSRSETCHYFLLGKCNCFKIWPDLNAEVQMNLK